MLELRVLRRRFGHTLQKSFYLGSTKLRPGGSTHESILLEMTLHSHNLEALPTIGNPLLGNSTICVASLLIVLFLAGPRMSLAQSGRTAADAEIDRIVTDELIKQNLIGVAVAVIENGVVTYSNGYGYADLGRRRPMTDNTVLRWASISKTLTAVAVMQLVESETINTTDLASSHSDWPSGGRTGRVTVDHLLQNRSGLHHYGKNKADKKVHNYNAKNYSSDGTGYNGASALKTFDKTVDFEPGTDYRYSTFGFNVLGSIVDKRSPEGDYVRHIEENIAKKIGVSLTVSRNHMTGYAKPCDGILALDTGEKNVEWKLPGGGWQSNVKDLARFGTALLNGELLDHTDSLWSVPNGQTYDRGINRRGSGRDMRVWHGGAHSNVRTILQLFPNRNIGVAVMINAEFGSAGRVARRIFREAFGLSLYDREDDVVHGCVESESCNGKYSGVWRKSGKDVVLRRGYNSKDFTTEWEFLRGQGYILQDIETYRARNSRRWDGVFKKSSPGSRLIRDQDSKSFGQKWDQYRKSGFQLVDIETYRDNGKRRWAGVFRKKSGRSALFRDMSSKRFGAKHDELAKKGYKLIDIETYTKGPNRKWAAVWTAGSGSLVNRGYSAKDFGALRTSRKNNGWKLIDIETYTKGTNRKWAGVWERSSTAEGLYRGWNYCPAKDKDGIATKMATLASDGYELIDWTVH